MIIGAPKPEDRFAVMSTAHIGPMPTFWRSMESVVDLLTRYVNNGCGQGVSVWRRKSPKGQWKLIAG